VREKLKKESWKEIAGLLQVGDFLQPYPLLEPQSGYQEPDSSNIVA